MRLILLISVLVIAGMSAFIYVADHLVHKRCTQSRVTA